MVKFAPVLPNTANCGKVRQVKYSEIWRVWTSVDRYGQLWSNVTNFSLIYFVLANLILTQISAAKRENNRKYVSSISRTCGDYLFADVIEVS